MSQPLPTKPKPPNGINRRPTSTILNELGVTMPTIMEILRHRGDAFLPAPEPAPAPEPPTETRTETRDRRAARAQRRHRIR